MLPLVIALEFWLDVGKNNLASPCDSGTYRILEQRSLLCRFTNIV